MKYSEIVDMSTAEVQEKLEIEQETLVKLKLNHSVSPLENPKLLEAKRKGIARLYTELRKRELNPEAKA